jgi:hypothetical protein
MFWDTLYSILGKGECQQADSQQAAAIFSSGAENQLGEKAKDESDARRARTGARSAPTNGQ